jgi:hypothetical protein
LRACTALILGVAALSTSSFAAERFIRLGTPPAPSGPVFAGETRVPAARPPAARPAPAEYVAGNSETAGPEGRLRLRPMNFVGGY